MTFSSSLLNFDQKKEAVFLIVKLEKTNLNLERLKEFDQKEKRKIKGRASPTGMPGMGVVQIFFKLKLSFLMSIIIRRR